MRNEWACFLLALQFLTRLPIQSDTLYNPERMARSVRYYPLVGVVIGILMACLYFLTSHLFEPYIAVTFCLAAGLLLTGAFHEDGLADTFDGIGGGLTRERSLEIMRDSRLGTYGTLALLVAIALKLGTLSSMPTTLIMASLIAGHALSRLSSVLTIATSRYVRDEGTGKPVSSGMTTIDTIVVFLTGFLIIVFWSLFLPLKVLVFGLVGLVFGHLFIRLFFERKLGGYTGDTLGAVQQSSEIGFYLGVCTWV